MENDPPEIQEQNSPDSSNGTIRIDLGPLGSLTLSAAQAMVAVFVPAIFLTAAVVLIVGNSETSTLQGVLGIGAVWSIALFGIIVVYLQTREEQPPATDPLPLYKKTAQQASGQNTTISHHTQPHTPPTASPPGGELDQIRACGPALVSITDFSKYISQIAADFAELHPTQAEVAETLGKANDLWAKIQPQRRKFIPAFGATSNPYQFWQSLFTNEAFKQGGHATASLALAVEGERLSEAACSSRDGLLHALQNR